MNNMHNTLKEKNIPNKLRLRILDAIHNAGSGHLGGSFSCIEILTALYCCIMRSNPADPHAPERDRFIMSKGHAAPALYITLAHCGYFPDEALDKLRMPDGILQGHPDMKLTPGVDFSSGSLGQGLSVGLGMALAAKHKGLPSRIYVLLGDGELNEGQVWEAAMAANKFKPDNLIPIVDWNGVQLDGTNEQIMPLGDLEAKWKAFGWKTIVCDGHDLEAVTAAIQQATDAPEPTVVLAKTVKGKGVSYMEGNHAWHGGVMNEEQYQIARAELMKGGE